MSKSGLIAAPRISAKEICLAGVMAAFVFIATFVPQIPIPLGYAHLGDGALFLAVFFAGRRAGVFAGAFGSGGGNYVVDAYPVLLKLKDVLLIFATILVVGCTSAFLTVRHALRKEVRIG